LTLKAVKLTFAPEALEAIADDSIKRKIGARGLRMILEELMLELMYDIPSQKNSERDSNNKGYSFEKI